MREEFNNQLKAAMKAGDKRRVETIRMINAGLKDKDIEARGQGKTVSDDDILSLLQKLIKSRQESAEIYEKAGRTDLSTQEREEIAIIQSFLPQALSPAETDAAIAAAIAETGATSIKDMGKVIGAAQGQICRPDGFRRRERRGEGEARGLAAPLSSFETRSYGALLRMRGAPSPHPEERLKARLEGRGRRERSQLTTRSARDRRSPPCRPAQCRGRGL